MSSACSERQRILLLQHGTFVNHDIFTISGFVTQDSLSDLEEVGREIEISDTVKFYNETQQYQLSCIVKYSNCFNIMQYYVKKFGATVWKHRFPEYLLLKLRSYS